VPHAKAWGVDMAVYLLTKGIATGTLLVSLLLSWIESDRSPLVLLVGPAISLAFLTLTACILVIDLERPERFYYILLRPNWRSWMAWGTFFLAAQGIATALWLAAASIGADAALGALFWPLIVVSILTTCYTGFLFAQGLARDLWQGPLSTIDLLAQAIVEGASVLLLAALVPGTRAARLVTPLAATLVAAMIVHIALIASENLIARSPTRHHALALAAIRRGPFAGLFWAGALVPAIASAIFGALTAAAPPALALAAVLALVGSFAWEYIWVEAGQSVPLS
jgi:formate-dependent nitrite reductase membrane component NrfD